jgi:hypothetical protein
MRELQFLCLAVGRRDGGNCIAGIDLHSGKWVRPVNARNHGALTDYEIIVTDGITQKPRILAPLDVIQMHIDEYVGNCGQPENWTVAATPNARYSTATPQASADSSLSARMDALAEASTSSGLLFGSDKNSIWHREIERRPLASSLCVAKPRYLRWQRETNYRGDPCINGYFDLGRRNIRHVLRLTDIAWEKRLLQITRKEAVIEHQDLPDIGSSNETFLTISLGDVFPQTGHHYKLIAGVIILPKR